MMVVYPRYGTQGATIGVLTPKVESISTGGAAAEIDVPLNSIRFVFITDRVIVRGFMCTRCPR